MIKKKIFILDKKIQTYSYRYIRNPYQISDYFPKLCSPNEQHVWLCNLPHKVKVIDQIWQMCELFICRRINAISDKNKHYLSVLSSVGCKTRPKNIYCLNFHSCIILTAIFEINVMWRLCYGAIDFLIQNNCTSILKQCIKKHC